MQSIPQGQGVYLIHFDTPYKHARHYLGFSTNICERIEAHRSGTGARLMEVIKAAGIGWTVARIWEGASRHDERALKNLKSAPSLCPICSQRPRDPALPVFNKTLPPGEIARRYANGLSLKESPEGATIH